MPVVTDNPAIAIAPPVSCPVPGIAVDPAQALSKGIGCSGCGPGGMYAKVLADEAVGIVEEFALAAGRGKEAAVGHIRQNGLLLRSEKHGEDLSVERFADLCVGVVKRSAVQLVLDGMIHRHIDDVFGDHADEVAVFSLERIRVRILFLAKIAAVALVDDIGLVGDARAKHAP